MPSTSICAHGICFHILPTCDCSRLSTGRLIHSDSNHATGIDMGINMEIAGHGGWALRSAANKSVVPGVLIKRRLEYGVTLWGVVCEFLAHDEQYSIFLCVLTHITGINSTIHIADCFLMLQVPNSARGPGQMCRWEVDGVCDTRGCCITEEALRAARVILSSTRDALFDRRYRISTIAYKLLWPIWCFLQKCDPPAEYINTFSELPGTHIVLGDEARDARPILPFYAPLPIHPQCELPAGQLVCCCERPALGDAIVMRSDVGPLEPIEEPGEQDRERDDVQAGECGDKEFNG